MAPDKSVISGYFNWLRLNQATRRPHNRKNKHWAEKDSVENEEINWDSAGYSKFL
jgi:hypothetical protein